MTHFFSNRNLWILFLAQFIATSGATQSATLGGILGDQFALNKVLATLPQAFHIVGIAAFTIPAALVMRRAGRPRGFSGSAVLALASQLLAVVAIFRGSFWLFTAAFILLGLSNAFAQQLRFAATEAVDPAHAGRAVSFVLLGAVGGAMLGPFLASHGVHWIPAIPYAGGFAVQALMFLLLVALYLTLTPAPTLSPAADIAATKKRSVSGLVRQPLFMVAVLAGVTSYAVMSLLMTATPISMHIIDGFTLEQTAGVIRAHVISMYLPSLVSGLLVDRFGIGKMMALGLLAMAGCIGIALNGHEYLHYWWALVLLGVGWNFLFVGGTTLLTRTYRPHERYTAQAINEFSVFGMAAIAALMAGVFIQMFDWNTAVWATVPLLLVLTLSLLLVRKHAQLH
ncbi:MAG: MFS transporter [Gammaproteobacteria bacterium]|nr:MFS transporter [Gammaproteobacteria bacterium]